MIHCLRFLFFIGIAGMVTGCNTTPVATPPPTIASVPAGFALIKDVVSLPKGTQLYEGDGKLFGTIQGHDSDYTFPNGKKGKATQIAFADNKASFWLPDEIIASSKCVKK